MNFLSENPRAELKPVIFTKLVAQTRNEIIHKTVRRHLALSGTYRRTSRAAALPALRRENAAEQAAIRHF
ncbi:hypothetical protein, partial [Gelatiniphilus marinus]